MLRIWGMNLFVAAMTLLFMGGLMQASAQDVQQDAGEAAYNNACRTCHSWKADDNRLGPHLHKIVGRKAGAAEGFAYSAAIKGAGLTWDEKTLDAFITNPDGVISGHNMKPYTGIADAGVRQSIIGFLKTKAAN
jgi:cytochrome c